jgi:hypothetical protein
MADNLWHIVNFDDLAILLRNNEKRFIVLTIITNETSDIIRVMLRKLIKEKAKKYQNVLFLYYKAQKPDFGNLTPLLEEDVTKYPKIFHLYNKEILSVAASIDDKVIPELSFKDRHEDYINAEIFKVKEVKEAIEEEKEEIKVKAPESDNLSKDEKKQSEKENIEEIIYKDPELEKKKNSDKIKLLQKMQKQCEIDFIEEYLKRKEGEERDSQERQESRLRRVR